MARARLRGKIAAQAWGAALRGVFEELGGAAVKIGQQLSVRIDLFPYPVCHELEQLVDRIPSFPTEQAVDIVERSAGEKRGVERVPLGEIFAAFDPNPIGSASIACVYQAELHTGQKVAVKVRRPGIMDSLGADLGVIDIATRILELLTIVRGGFFKNLRSELRSMLAEEVDFAAEARYTRLFRYNAKKDKLKWITAPKVYTQFSGQSVLVMEFASGFWCSEVLAARENNDQRALAQLAARGITPKKVGKRLMEYSFWSRFEALFFHADPHHGNIIVADGCKLVFIDFGSCGTTSRKSRLAQLMIMDRMRYNDVSGTVEAAVSTLEPLPCVDVYELKKEVESNFWNWLFAFRDKQAEWWERTTAGLWLALLEVTRQMQIPIGLETLRLARSLLLIDTLCFRLDPSMVSPDAFIRYERRAMRRGAQQAKREEEKKPFSQYTDTLIKETHELLSRARYMAWKAERVVDGFPNEFAGSVSKVSYFLSEVLRVGMLAAAIGVVGFVYVWSTGRREPGDEWAGVADFVASVFVSPVPLGLGLFLLFLLYRRLNFRTHDLDVDRRGGLR
jgi:predicted unusual protein kinase regulating ubiquinone biosynthesis (AarF/ABC1/UbiB family)